MAADTEVQLATAASGAGTAATEAGATSPSVARRRAASAPGRISLSLGTDAEVIAPPGAAGAIARISSPANGMVVAIDPDIPLRHQRVPLAAEGAAGSTRLTLNGEPVGPATAPVLWQPRSGAHVLALEDGRGRTLDRILFTVR